MPAAAVPNERSSHVADLPAVSAILLSYNCEDFIAVALESVLNQDYDGPLEVIVSDDGSTDRTFDVLQENLARYRGPHRVELSRRAANSGSKGAHLNEIWSACSGDVLVFFDGDDIAERSRISRLAERFGTNPSVQAVYSGLSFIDNVGRPQGIGHVPRPPPGADARAWFARVDAYAAGSTLAVRRTIVEQFGRLAPDVNEDVILPFRASLLGNVEFVAEPLVKYRRHAASLTADWQRFSSIAAYRTRMEDGIEKARRAELSRLADLQRAAVLMPERQAEWERVRGIVGDSMRAAEMTRPLTSPSFVVRMRTLLSLVHASVYKDEFPQHMFLALMPGLYLRYKRHKLGAGSSAVAQC